MTVMLGGPPMLDINAGVHVEFEAGLAAGLAGQEWAVPLNEDGLFARYPSPGPQMAAWSRGHIRGRLRFLAEQRKDRGAPLLRASAA